jgi:hypothetical protein
LVCIRNNHEVHFWLDKREAAYPDGDLFPIDPYGRLLRLKIGHIWTFNAGDENLRVLGIGRVGSPNPKKTASPSKAITEEEIEALETIPANEEIEVLLTHDSVPEYRPFPGSGLVQIQYALNRHDPVYHFFGHWGGPCEQGTHVNGLTRFVKLADLAWREKDDCHDLLHEGCVIHAAFFQASASERVENMTSSSARRRYRM